METLNGTDPSPLREEQNAETPTTSRPPLAPPPKANINLDEFQRFEIAGTRYVAVDSVFRLKTFEGKDAFITVIDASPRDFHLKDEEWIENFALNAEKTDDVFCRAFLGGIILTGLCSPDIPPYPRGAGWFMFAPIAATELKPGLYLHHKDQLRPVCRLYEDTQKAFVAGLKPRLGARYVDETCALVDSNFRDIQEQFERSANQTFEQLANPTKLAVPVTSRLAQLDRRTTPPLRIAVQDRFHLRGLETSLCNSSCYQVAEPDVSTAAVVQSLVDQGHQVVGITKSSPITAPLDAMDAVDLEAALNPRGDGHQSSAGSNSGSAVAVASYDWLDCAIGGDTSSGGRRSALAE